MIQSVPTPKLVIVSNETRKPLKKNRPQPKTKDPADFRWGLVEEFLRSRELSSNTKTSYTREFKRFLAWTDKGLNALTARDMDRYKAHLKELPSRRGGTLSTASVNQALYAVQSFFKWLTARDYIAKNPMLNIEKLKPDPARSLEWSEEDVAKLFDVLPERENTLWRDQALLWILLHGLRATEASNLNLKDFDGKRLHILEAKYDSVGTVPLRSEAVDAIENYINWRVSENLPVSDDAPMLLSHSRNSYGKRLQYSGVYDAVEAIAKLAKVEKAFPHRGRHTFGTDLVLKGIDPILGMELMRQKTAKSFKRYTKRGLAIAAENKFYEVYGE